MKNLLHKYIGWWLIPKYKRLVQKIKLWYDKYQYWKYGIEADSAPRTPKNKDCCHGKCKCESKEGKDI